MANHLLKIPLKITEPIKGLPESELSYNGWTVLTILTFPRINAVKLTGQFSNVILPTIWNYLDAACAITVGVNQLLDEDNYRQKQMKIKGLLNIMSGIQLFLFTYNPALTAAVGLAGAPIAFAGFAFALAASIEIITAAIDLCNASKELDIPGWLREKQKEYQFTEHTLKELQKENDFFSLHIDPANPEIQWALDKNNARIGHLTEKRDILKEEVLARARTHQDQSAQFKSFLQTLDPSFDEHQKPSPEDSAQDTQIQEKLVKKFKQERNNILVKTVSFVGLTLLAVGTFALFTTCPYAIAVLGLAITVAISALYLYRHHNAVSAYLTTAFKDCKDTLFSSQDKPSSKPLSTEDDLSGSSPSPSPSN